MKTKFDLYVSASGAAAGTLGAGTNGTKGTKGTNDLSELGAQELALKVFREEKGQEADWPFWKQVFDERREFFSLLRGQKAPSEPTDEKLKG